MISLGENFPEKDEHFFFYTITKTGTHNIQTFSAADIIDHLQKYSSMGKEGEA